jgi:hypothetical protein
MFDGGVHGHHVHYLRILVFQLQMVRDDVFAIVNPGVHYWALAIAAHVESTSIYSRRVPRVMKRCDIRSIES